MPLDFTILDDAKLPLPLGGEQNHEVGDVQGVGSA